MPSRTYFLYPFLIIYAVVLALWTTLDHGDAVIWINQHRLPVLDYFFMYWTHLGDGILVGIFVLILLIRRWRAGVLLLAIGVAQFVVSQGLKRYVFSDIPRPSKYFEGKNVLQLIDGIQHHGSFSFPSGHSITAFATATFFAILFKENKLLSVGLLLAAILVGISRIYLLQHFLRDVLAGSMLGVIIAVVVFKLFEKFLQKGELSSKH